MFQSFADHRISQAYCLEALRKISEVSPVFMEKLVRLLMDMLESRSGNESTPVLSLLCCEKLLKSLIANNAMKHQLAASVSSFVVRIQDSKEDLEPDSVEMMISAYLTLGTFCLSNDLDAPTHQEIVLKALAAGLVSPNDEVRLICAKVSFLRF